MATLFGKLAQLAIATIPAMVVKAVLSILHWLGQKATRAVMELLAIGIYYTGGWLLWAIWVLAVWAGWKVLPTVQHYLPAAADVWATATLFVMAIGLALWTTRHRRLAVRNRRALRELRGEIRGMRGDLLERMAERTRGKPGGGWFSQNREADRADAERAEREYRAAEAERLATEAEERRRQAEMAAGFDPYETLSS